jgi:hypothetical protein
MDGDIVYDYEKYVIDMRYEARLNKKDESLSLQNKVSAEQTVNKIEAIYGPISNEEIEHYRKKLTKGGAPVINNFQKQIVGYLYDKDFGDPITINAIHNQTEYIKLLIAGKRILQRSGMVILPYILSSRVTRVATRKIISKKDMVRMENSALYQQIKMKYNNPKIEQKIWEFIGGIISSSYEIIDFDEENNCPGKYDGAELPIINDTINEELMIFITFI